jgi:DNA-binding protein HU-beta
MNTTDLIERVAAVANGEEASLAGFGRFKLTSREARQGRNPATGETIDIPASKKLAFTAAKNVRDALNNGKSASTPTEKQPTVAA